MSYAYLGVGVIASLHPSEDRQLVVARVTDFQPFDAPVPFKIDGDYIEAVPDRGGSATGVYFRGTSVREISEAVFDRILSLAEATALGSTEHPDAGPEPAEMGAVAAAHGYPAAERSRAIDEAGMRLAIDEVRLRWPEAQVERMPHANPGFDLLVARDDGPWYVEVKSTASHLPRFFLSEGERLFAAAHAGRYSLLVITAVETGAVDAPRSHWRDGAIDGPDVTLQPRQWSGLLAVD